MVKNKKKDKTIKKIIIISLCEIKNLNKIYLYCFYNKKNLKSEETKKDKSDKMLILNNINKLCNFLKVLLERDKWGI